MRYFFLLIILVLPFGSANAQKDSTVTTVQEDRCKVETDEFREAQTIYCKLRDLEIQERPGEEIFNAEGRLQRGADGQGLLIVTASESWNFIGENKAYAIIDGENYKFRLARVDQEVKTGGGVVEQRGIGLTDQQLRAVAQADTIRVKIGRAVFKLPAQPFSKDAEFMLQQ